MPDLSVVTTGSSRTFRPQGPRIVAYVVAVLLVVMTVAIGIALPSYVVFRPSEIATLLLILAASIAGLHAVGRSKVVVDDERVQITNGYRRHDIAWSDVKGFAMGAGAPWPTLVTRDDERYVLFALQGTDAARTREALAWLRSKVR